MAKRKSCDVHRRDVIAVKTFNRKDKSTFDGTETVRGLNKFDRKWFKENLVAVIFTSKTFYGRTFVVPYKDIDGVRYWLVDDEKLALARMLEK